MTKQLLYRWLSPKQADRYIRRFGGHLSERVVKYPWRLLYNRHKDPIAYVVVK